MTADTAECLSSGSPVDNTVSNSVAGTTVQFLSFNRALFPRGQRADDAVSTTGSSGEHPAAQSLLM